MNLFKKPKILHAAFMLLAYGTTMLATQPIQKVSGSTDAFSGTITSSATAIDPYNGDVYAGTYELGTAANLNTDGTSAISKAGRTDTSFTPFATATGATSPNGDNILTLDLISPNPAAAATHLPFVRQFNVGSGVLSVMKLSDKTIATHALDDAAGAVSDYISVITTSSRHIFARVWNTKTEGDDAGIANLVLSAADDTTFVPLQGSSSVVAKKLDPTDGSSSPLGVGLDPASVVVNDMVFDEDLGQLYVGLNVLGQASADAGMFGIVRSNFQTDGLLATFGNPTEKVPVQGDTSAVFAYRNSGTEVVRVNISKIRVMTTSTGLKYLVVAGGVGVTPGALGTANSNTVGNQVRALRIAQGNGTGFLKGDIIRNDRFQESMLTLAGDPDEAITDSFNAIRDLDSSIVGSSNLEWDATVTVSDMVVCGDAVFVSAVTNTRSAANNPGIFASHAMFDHNGRIAAWTKWERIFPSIDNDAANGVANDSIPFFEVDAANGKIWAGNSIGKEVRRLQWQTANSTATSLQNVATTAMSNGCFSVLDLPPSTPGIMNDSTYTDNSLVLFGGFEKVCFARTSYGSTRFVTTDAVSAQDFGDSANFTTESTGLSGVGPVRSLGYTYLGSSDNPDNKDTGFFFAGTNNGLFAYAQPTTGAGFNSDSDGGGGLTTLAVAPFIAGTWQQVDLAHLPSAAISEIITIRGTKDASSTGADRSATYVVELDKTTQDGIVDKLHEIPLSGITGNVKDTVSELIARNVAKSGYAGLPTNAVFSGLAIVTNGSTNNTWFGVLSTNNGIYTTTCDIRDLAQVAVATDTTTQQEWEVVNKTSGISFYTLNRFKDSRMNTDRITAEDSGDIGSGNETLRATGFHGIYRADDQRDLGIFDNSRLLQGGSSTTAVRTNAKLFDSALSLNLPLGEYPVEMVPDTSSIDARVKDRRFFLNKATGTTELDATVGMKSDGCRRFLIRYNPSEDGTYNSIQTFPYNGTGWNVGTTGPMADADLATLSRVHWIETLSGTGQIAAGTDAGVIMFD